MKSVVAKNTGRASPLSPESVEAELYANVRMNLFYMRRFYLAFPNVHTGVNNCHGLITERP